MSDAEKEWNVIPVEIRRAAEQAVDLYGTAFIRMEQTSDGACKFSLLRHDEVMLSPGEFGSRAHLEREQRLWAERLRPSGYDFQRLGLPPALYDYPKAK